MEQPYPSSGLEQCCSEATFGPSQQTPVQHSSIAGCYFREVVVSLQPVTLKVVVSSQPVPLKVGFFFLLLELLALELKLLQKATRGRQSSLLCAGS